MDDQLCDDADIDRLERRNALLQLDEIRRLAAVDRAQRGCVTIDAALVKRMHVFATTDIFSFAGQFRHCPIAIGGTSHKPPPADEVPGYVDEMCRYVIDNWDAKPVHLCSYLLPALALQLDPPVP
ncbi:MAG: Fic family protein [Deltaproteobacteria bacterium]|nr:MAG: Fic family protein [Deltaproteobacteria bacterium]